jgi:RNA binding exosome subunit
LNSETHVGELIQTTGDRNRLKGPIQSVEVTFILHATEDSDRVVSAVLRLLGTTRVPEFEHLEGHFGNVIIRARLHLEGAEAGEAFANVVSVMPQSVRVEIIKGMASFMDEHSALFIRLDKQLLISGSVQLGFGDSVRIRVKPRIFLLKGGAARFYTELLGGR